jgi:subtilase family serine protease
MRRAVTSWLFTAATLTLLLGSATTASATTHPATATRHTTAQRHTTTTKAPAHKPFALPAGIHPACAPSTRPGVMACTALTGTRHSATKATPSIAPTGYGPADLQAAYGLQSAIAGTRQTVAIVDAYDDPNAESDLGVYRSQYGLTACTTANGCFKKIDQSGGTNYPTANPGWATEISIDLDTISAVCPNCHLLLVEGNSPGIDDLGTGVNTAVSLGAKIIANSYSGPETATDTTWDTEYYNHPGVAMTAPTGNNGYGVSYPAASHYVTAVAGTTLSKTTGTNTRGWTENAWPGSGSGCSAYDPKPAWQHDTGCTNRTVADVAADADSNTPVATYDTYNAGGWLTGSGTGLSSDIVAATYALAGTPGAADYPASYPYTHPGALNDITVGSNGSCTTSYLCNAQTGYDAPTGLGTPADTTSFTATGGLTGQVVSGYNGSCMSYADLGGGAFSALNTSCSGTLWGIQSDSTLRTNGKCLDVMSAGTTNGTLVDLYTCNGTGSQKWDVRSNGELINPQSGRCLDSPSNPTSASPLVSLEIDDCTDVIGQRWTLPYSVPGSTGPIVSGIASGPCVDDASAKTTNGNKIDIYPCNSSNAQKWAVGSDGTVRTLGKCMDVTSAGTANGTTVDLYDCNYSGAQQWAVRSDGSLLNPESGRCLADPAGTNTPGTQLIIWTCDGGSEQQWKLS